MRGKSQNTEAQLAKCLVRSDAIVVRCIAGALYSIGCGLGVEGLINLVAESRGLVVAVGANWRHGWIVSRSSILPRGWVIATTDDPR